MHAEYLHDASAIAVDLHGLFTEAGLIPDGGGLWIVPTETFLRIWDTPAGEHLRERGFRLDNDGRLLGASQDCVVHLPAVLVRELFG